MDTTQWPQGIGVVKQPPSMEAATRGALTTTDPQQQSKRPRPQKEQALNCPRCHSTNTKFCYYNNYSLTQPRYFCKTCRRYWTEGGSLRNVPVGGGSRKNSKRSTPTSPSSSSSPSSKKLLIPHDHHHPHLMVVAPQNPRIQQLGGGGACQDLNLAYPPITSNTTTTTTTNGGGDYHMIFNPNPNPNPNLNSSVEFLKSGANGVGSFLPISVSDSGAGIFQHGFHMQEFKPSLNFTIDGGFGNGYGGVVQESGGGGGGGDTGSARLFFPFEEVKQSASGPNTSGGGDQFDEHDDQQEIHRGQQGEANGYWSGMLGGGHGGSW